MSVLPPSERASCEAEAEAQIGFPVFPADAPRAVGAARESGDARALWIDTPRGPGPDPREEPIPWIAALVALAHRYTGREQMQLLVQGFPGIPGALCLRLEELGALRAGELDRVVRTALTDASAVAPARWGAGAVGIALSREPAALAPACELRFAPDCGGKRMRIDCDAALFSAPTAERLGRHLCQLRAAIEAEPASALADLPLLDVQEQRELEALMRGPALEREHEPVLAHFARQVAERPDATALLFEGREPMTYAELARRSDALARHLRERGVVPGDFVAVCLRPAPEIAVAFLAVWKAGAVYVPLDPTHPVARLEIMLEDTRPALLITQRDLEGELRLPCPRVYRVGDPLPEAEALPGPDPIERESRAALDAPAYVFYTSGTTGKPKGVLASHRNLAHYVSVARERYGFGPSDVFASVARYTFSISLWELVTPLTCGAALRLLAREHVIDTPRLARTLGGISAAHIGPSLLKPLLRFARARPELVAAFDRMRHISSGGDLVPPEVLDQLRRCFRRAEVFVIYGCTEISCMGCTWEVPREEPELRTRVGRPFPGVAVRVVDAAGRPVPIGVTGEVCFSGPGLAIGYLNRPELTAEKFAPLGAPGEERFYRTGDVGRIHASGDLELLGRRDYQVQLHGIRVELGEIEVQLRRAPGVRDAVVAARPGPGGETLLVGYAVCEEGSSFDPRALRAFLETQLPDYMVPARFVALDALPLNLNLKVDRAALPAPEDAPQSRAVRAGRPPASESEARLVALLEAALGWSGVDLDADFRAHGGTSLLAMQLNARLYEECGSGLPLDSLLSSQPLHELVRALERRERAEGARWEWVPSSAESAPLSSSQQRIWHADAVTGEGLAYVVPQLYDVDPDVDEARLERALQALVQRHSVLATAVEIDRGVPRPRLDPGAQVALERVHAESEDARARAIFERVRTPFDLSRAPLLRASLLRAPDGSAQLLLCFHHLVYDESSSRVLERELPQLYAADGADVLPPLAHSYAEYASSEQRALEEGVFEAPLAYWRRSFPSPPEPLDLPLDHPRPPARAPRAAAVELDLDASSAQALRRAGEVHECTLFQLMVAVWGQLLGRTASQPEVLVGTAVANRALAGSEELIGCFINLIPLRVPAALDAPLPEWLGRVRASCLEGLEHSGAPFDRIVQAIAPPRDASRTPLVQTLVIHEDARPELPRDGLGLAPRSHAFCAALTDLTLWVRESSRGLHLVLDYDASLFLEESAGQLLEQLGVGLRALAERAHSPSAPARLDFLSDAERRLLHAQNAATRREISAASFLPRVLEQMRSRADRTAVRDRRGGLSYGELERRSRALALRLRAQGVEPGALVGICLPRSRELLVAALGVLRAGAAYVPLDPSYPRARLAHMVRDSGLRCAIACAQTRDALPAGTPIAELDGPASQGEPQRLPEVGSEALAYVIYTSGSTGVPKGVRVPHGAVANFLESMAREPGLGEGDVLAAVTTLSFDISVLELFGPLCAGAQVAIADAEQCSSGSELSLWLRTSRATVLQATPATWSMLLQAGHVFAPGFVGLCGGEALPESLARDLIAAGVALWNMYGPTETTVWSSCERVRDPARISVGRPIANTAFYVRDEAGMRLPRGMPGELAIGGRGVTLGYLDRDELTRARFLPDPYGEAEGGRLYCTGDRVRQLCDGRYQHLGRLDAQIKLRGHRIELGEIETALSDLEVGSACAVAVRSSDAGDPRLVAFVVGLEGEPSRVGAEIRTRLGQRLPHYMIPQHVVPVPELPRTENGKLDRRALGRIPWSTGARPLARAKTATERRVLGILQQALGGQEIGVDDSFFDSGGHSLLAVQVTGQLQNAFGVSFPLGVLFQYPSARELAAQIESSADFAPRPIRLGGRPELPSLFLLLGVYLYRPLALRLDAECSVYGVYLHREMAMTDASQRPPSVQELARDYIEVLRREQPTGPYRIGGASLGGVVAFEVAQQLTAMGEAVEQLVLLDAQLPRPWPRRLWERARRALARPGRDLAHAAFARLRAARRARPAAAADPAAAGGPAAVEALDRARMNAYKRTALAYASDLRPYRGPATLVLAAERTRKNPLLDPSDGWSRFLPALRLVTAPGDHLEILSEPNVARVAEQLRERSPARDEAPPESRSRS